jgi:peptidoglycan/LPS O-acetylase OafA/YrhL
MCLVSVAACRLLLGKAEAREMLWPGLAAMGQVSNWRTVLGGGPTPFSHCWSLSVEWQFYLVFPFLVALVCRGGPGSGRRAAVMALLAAASAAWACVLLATGSGTNRIYLGLDCQLVPLLLGAALGMGGRLPGGWPAGLAAILGLGACIACWTFDSTPALLATLLASSACAAVLIHAAGLPGSPLGRVLAWPPLVAVGTLSYSLYLWHFPAANLALHGHLRGLYPGWAAAAIGGAASAACALLSYFLVERPFQRLKFRLAHRPTVAPPAP